MKILGTLLGHISQELCTKWKRQEINKYNTLILEIM